jgi:hypothetical protein
MAAEQKNLYSKDGQYPSIVTTLYLPDGTVRTNPPEWTEDLYELCGYTGPYTQPEYDEDYQDITWDSETKTFKVLNKSPEWWLNQIKDRRNLLLSKTDWCVLPDSPLSPSELEKIKNLREELRNIPQNINKTILLSPTNKEEFRKIFTDIISIYDGEESSTYIDLSFY